VNKLVFEIDINRCIAIGAQIAAKSANHQALAISPQRMATYKVLLTNIICDDETRDRYGERM
jgi:hypothetical protein